MGLLVFVLRRFVIYNAIPSKQCLLDLFIIQYMLREDMCMLKQFSLYAIFQ
jgi:hypothetical protein